LFILFMVTIFGKTIAKSATDNNSLRVSFFGFYLS